MRKHLFVLTIVASALAAEWRVAEPGWQYDFPRDHHSHRDFKTEWWYFTGNLFDDRGRRFGYQLTFFRQGIRPAAERPGNISRFVVDDLKFAHFTVTDVFGGRFRFEQKVSRGAFGEAGFDDGDRLVWMEPWSLRMTQNGEFHLKAETTEASVNLRLVPMKAPVIHGQEGVSAKASGEGRASHYYSITRLRTDGELRVGKNKMRLRGESWFDHEWATNQLGPGQVGWDWLSMQLEDGSELMLYQMRLENGAPDQSSGGTLIAADGTSTHLPSTSFRMNPIEFWTSKRSGARYPVGWRVEIPEEQMEFTVRASLDDQELVLSPLTYWEGAIDASGERRSLHIKGRGYLELTGYAGPLRELQR